MTSEEKQSAKLEKKREKLEVKLAKKQSGAEQVPAQVNASQSGGASNRADASTPSPAERSARAAERQVRLQSLRVIFALLGVLLTAAMLIWTIRPWEKFSDASTPASPEPTVETSPSP